MTVAPELPFLTDIDLLISGEGILDPLGLATTSDRLAEHVLPGLRARMARPRFLTVMAVSAAVCEDLPEVGRDGVTPPHVVFEWLLTEGFARAGRGRDTVNTPGTLKAQAVYRGGESMSARSYLKSPAVFGLHGVYKPIAVAAGIVSEDFELREHGYELVRTWEREQGIDGFLERALGGEAGRNVRLQLQAAIRDALDAGHTTRSPGWQHWEFFARHLTPGELGTAEGNVLYKLLADPAGPRAEVFDLMSESGTYGDDDPEWDLAGHRIRTSATGALKGEIDAIQAFEAVGTTLEAGLNRLLFRSSQLRDRALTVSDFAKDQDVRTWAMSLRDAIARAEDALAIHPLELQSEFGHIAKAFGHVKDENTFFEALLARHAAVQHAKKPDGKREWVEHSAEGGVFVRPMYRMETLEPQPVWGRPYRFTTVRSFCRDLYHGKN